MALNYPFRFKSPKMFALARMGLKKKELEMPFRPTMPNFTGKVCCIAICIASKKKEREREKKVNAEFQKIRKRMLWKLFSVCQYSASAIIGSCKLPAKIIQNGDLRNGCASVA